MSERPAPTNTSSTPRKDQWGDTADITASLRRLSLMLQPTCHMCSSKIVNIEFNPKDGGSPSKHLTEHLNARGLQSHFIQILGNGQTGEITQDMDSLSKAAQKFLDREEIKGCVFVPKVYLPGIPQAIDDPSKLAQKEKTKRSIKGNFKGDKTERILYKSLQNILSLNELMYP